MSYLNHQTKLNIIGLGGISQWLKLLTSKCKDKDINKRLNSAATNIEKSYLSKLQNMSQEDKRAILNMARNYGFTVEPIFVNTDKKEDISVLIQAAGEKCLTCNCNYHECDLRKALHRMGVKGNMQDGCEYNPWGGNEDEQE